MGHFYLFEDSIDSIEERNKSGPLVPKIHLEIQTIIKSDDLLNGNVTPKNNKKIKMERKIPILYGYLEPKQYSIKSDNRQISLIYGLANKPLFEQISFQECQKLAHHNNKAILMKDSSIIKSLDLFNKPTVINQTTHTKIKSAKHSDKTTVIGPAGMVPNQPLFNNINSITNVDSEMMFNEHDSLVNNVLPKNDDEFNNNNLKRKYPELKNNDDNNDKNNDCSYKKINKSIELTLDEKLKLVETNENNKKENNQIKNPNLSKQTNLRQKNKLMKKRMDVDDDKDIRTQVDSLVNVLIQGLQSNDIKMLSTALSMNKDKVLNNTIKKLPTEHVPAFLTVLEKGLCQNGEHHSIYLRWIKSLLRHKISFLMTVCIFSNCIILI